MSDIAGDSMNQNGVWSVVHLFRSSSACGFAWDSRSFPASVRARGVLLAASFLGALSLAAPLLLDVAPQAKDSMSLLAINRLLPHTSPPQLLQASSDALGL